LPKRNRKPAKKAWKAIRKKAKMPSKPKKAQGISSSRAEPKNLASTKSPLKILVAPIAEAAKEGTGFKIAIDRIDADTVIGDLLVVFPRTREVLQKHGLRLDVEDAGDIYMTLQAFTAMRGLNTGTLIQELVEASKEPAGQTYQVPTLTTPPPA
jgi:hypothetical protein